MTVATTAPRVQFTGNGATTGFPFAAVFTADSDIAVDLRDLSGNQVAAVLNGIGSYDYTIVGTRDATSGEYLGGATITFRTAPPSGYQVTLFRDPPEQQTLALTAGGKLPAAAVNSALDSIVMQVQALMDRASRSLMGPVRDQPRPSGPDMTLPAIAVRASGILGFDSLGRPAVGGNLATLISLLAGSWTPSLPNITGVATIAALKVLTPPGSYAVVAVEGYYAAGDKPVCFYGYQTASSATDDGGMFIKPTSVSGGSPGRWQLLTQGQPFNVLDWGADPTAAGFSDTAFANWFAALVSFTASGYLPQGSYRFAAQAYWNLSSVATSGVKITGDGVQRSILDFTGVASSPALLIGASSDLFYPTLRDFGVKGSLAGIVLQLGHEDYSDPINEAAIDLAVVNTSTSASAVAVELNYVLNCRPLSLVANCAGHGTALRMRQASFNTMMGSFGNADIGVDLTAGYNYGNVVVAPDIEAVGVCVQFNSSNAVNNVFLGGTYVWSGAAAINAALASNYNRFVAANFGVAGTYLTGAAAAAVLIEDKYLGTSPFGGILISPPAGDGDATLDSVAGTSAFQIFKRGGLTRWQWGRNNAAEGGANAGSQLVLEAFDDAGASLGNALHFDRATGRLTIEKEFATAAGTKVGLFGAPPIVQPGASGSDARAAAGAGAAVLIDTTFTGGTGATAYTLGKLVAALKAVGVIAS